MTLHSSLYLLYLLYCIFRSCIERRADLIFAQMHTFVVSGVISFLRERRVSYLASSLPRCVAKSTNSEQ